MKTRAVTYMKFERVFFLIVAAKFAKDHAFYGVFPPFLPPNYPYPYTLSDKVESLIL